nr:IS4 family transposase [Aphanothece hegewaldii]
MKHFNIEKIWMPFIKVMLFPALEKERKLILAIDRTQWKENNIFMISLIWKKRAIPIYWQSLAKKGASNWSEQKALISPAIKLFKDYSIVIISDREFHSAQLADWLSQQNLLFAFRQKRNTYMRSNGKDYCRLNQLGLQPGTHLFFQSVEFTKNKGFGRFNLTGCWPRKYRGKVLDEGWFILTNLSSLSETLAVYRTRMGIEALFKDCKSGGYNLEDSQASPQRLSSLILVIAIAYTCAVFQGAKIKHMGYQKYVSRQTEKGRRDRRHSDFWVGLYGQMWLPNMRFCTQIIQQLLALSPAHNRHYQRGLLAMSSIEKATNFSS